ncbi:MAG: monofunctional biosynthetic peptidoglycan transglycosylase [Proteobacteria bacterium]|nr:monofunctional biosynthetic peptidoglycan transglycosylase [Pseudomonadota bacterium]
MGWQLDRRRWTARLRPLFRRLIIGLAIVLALPYAIAPLYRLFDPVSTLMAWRWFTGARVERTVVTLAQIAPTLPLAVIVAEDARYCRHFGIDLRELRVAIADADDLADMRGVSTITQQTAKNLFLWPGRSYLRKALEVPLSLWLELVLGKRRVLEIYLNIAEWGANGEFGVEAASLRAFGKPARRLSGTEAALLAAMLPNPLARDTRRPGRGLRRLAASYQARANAARGLDDCIGGA